MDRQEAMAMARGMLETSKVVQAHSQPRTKDLTKRVYVRHEEAGKTFDLEDTHHLLWPLDCVLVSHGDGEYSVTRSGTLVPG